MASRFSSSLSSFFLVVCLTGLLGSGAFPPVQASASCDCPAVYDPVCSSKTQITYSNNCTASCASNTETWTQGSCDYDNPFDRCVPVLCLDDPCLVSSRSYPDALSAANCLSVRCLNATDWNWPPKPLAPCSAIWMAATGDVFSLKTDLSYVLSTQCPCTSQHAPVCGRDNNTYPNACTAGCFGVPVGYNGPCGANPADCICPAVLSYVCGADNRTYENSCEAWCAGTTVQYVGICNQPPIKGPPPPPPAVRPPPRVPRSPPADPADDPPTSPFTPLIPQILMYSPPPPPPERKCSQCPFNYVPVCGIDYKVYPNRCVLDCLGVKWKRDGRCAYCTGALCGIGKLHDLCMLAAPSAMNCWSVKYTCQPSPDLKGGVLGKCLPKPASPPSPPVPQPSPPRKAAP